MRLFLLLAFSALMVLEARMFNNEIDKQALLEFKSQASKDKRVFLSSWNTSLPLRSWYGVKCEHKHKRVTSLNLRGLQLDGVISPSIGNLSFLISLDLSENSFSGIIPQELGKLFRLEHLSMSSNFLKGKIPTSLFNCSRLLTFDLASNPLGQDVPLELGSLTKLVVIDLSNTNLKGKLPASLGNLTSLKRVRFANNQLEGESLDYIARLTQIEALDLSMNKFSGVFPPSIYNFSSLKFLNIFGNGFSGSLRSEFGNLLPNLQELDMGNNSFTGTIPTSLANISTLENLKMEFNRLTGRIPTTFGKVQNLRLLTLHSNDLGSSSVGDLDFLDSLTNCTKLHTLLVGNNTLGGDLPTSVANMSTNLIELSFALNFISGSIPQDIGNLVNLQQLGLYVNLLTGSLPYSLGKLSRLVAFSAHSNKMSGFIPSSISNITSLETLELYNNSFQGSLPKDVGGLEHLGTLSVAHNKLSGKLPESLGNCISMEELYLQDNSFHGTIPNISVMATVKKVDFSNNKFHGSIPEYLAYFHSLVYLNLSVNNLEGEVPTTGIFKNATIVSVFGNKNLHGGVLDLHLKLCFSQAPRKKVLIGVSIGVSLLLMLLIASSLSLRWLRKRNKNKTSEANPYNLGPFHEQMSYKDLRNATDGFSSNNLIGSGSFGTVFKALLPTESNIVAVKVLNMQRRGAMKSFMAECESLKEIRHRNLVKLLTTCSSIDFQGNEFRALIYEFMPNGSLDIWLHPEEVEETRRPLRTLTLLERLNIAIDVASVLDYLHVQCHEPIAHCDLNPSNILLDDDLTAHVSDFGLARILLKFDMESFLNQLISTGVKGTIGYAAPEYRMGGQVSIHGDVYSFGILLLEMFSGKRPTNELFDGNLTLRSYIKSALSEQVLDVADKLILHNGLRIGFPIAACLTLVFEVGVMCCEESPMNRMVMSEVVKELIAIKERFFKTRRRARH